MLFDLEEATTDWFDVCPNADVFLPSDEDLKTFDIGRIYLTERDRVRVQHILHKGHSNRKYMMMVLINTIDRKYHAGILYAARELYQKVSDDIFCSVLAFSFPGGSRDRLQFPAKQHKIPRTLMKAFGLRQNQIGWFNKLVANEDFVRLVGNQIKPSDWKHIPLYDTTLLETPAKQATAPKLVDDRGESLW